MGEKNKNNMVFKYSVLILMIMAAGSLRKTGEEFHAALSFWEKMETAGDSAGTDFRYEKRFQKTLSHYRFFENLYQPEDADPVPGLESTDILGESCGYMVPQGICIAGDYMLVTAYDSGDFYKNPKQGAHKINPSVLYVLSNQTPGSRELLTTIVLPDRNHVGGVAFDGKNIWIAKSTDRACSVISYETLKEAVNSGKSSYKLSEYGQDVYCGAVASFVTWHEGRLWVGTYSNRMNGRGMLRSYKVGKQQAEEGEILTLEKQEEIVIPEFANGAAFMERGERTYLAVTTSQGRYFDSEVHFYQAGKDPLTGRSVYHYYDSCKFPPMAEELACDGDKTYFLFESSAACYSAPIYRRCSYPVDRICGVVTAELFRQNHRELFLKDREKKFSTDLPICLPVYFYPSRRKKSFGLSFLVIIPLFLRQKVDNTPIGELYCNQWRTGESGRESYGKRYASCKYLH